MRWESAIAALLFAAALAIYVWGHVRRRARRYRSARRFAGALLNRYGLEAQIRASQQLERAITPRERAFRRAVLEVLSKPGMATAGAADAHPASPVARPEAEKPAQPKPVPEDASLEFDGYRRRRFSRSDAYFFAAVILAAGGAITLILYG